ncbi:MAG: insulinase family protein, partial [Clostridia bacterium]|nr:insulinase family protein [Clostridia bacterium]
EFERAKKVEYGSFLRLWNSVEGISNTMVSDLFKNINIFDFPKVFGEITFDDVVKRFKTLFKKENCVISIIEPTE